jgi:hypothetical protein
MNTAYMQTLIPNVSQKQFPKPCERSPPLIWFLKLTLICTRQSNLVTIFQNLFWLTRIPHDFQPLKIFYFQLMLINTTELKTLLL